MSDSPTDRTRTGRTTGAPSAEMKSAGTSPLPDDVVTPPVARRHPSDRGLTIGMGLVAAACATVLLVAWLSRSARLPPTELTWIVPSAVTTEPSPAVGTERLEETVTDAQVAAPRLDVQQITELAKAVKAGSWEAWRATAHVGPAGSDIPPAERWQVVLPANLSETQYARSVAALKVEIGVLRTGGSIDYLAQWEQPQRRRRSGPASEEKRFYLTWQRGELDQADRSLLAAAGIETTDEIVLHFCGPETVKVLGDLEREYEQHQPDQIQQTQFSVKQTFRGYEVYVTSQQLRDK